MPDIEIEGPDGQVAHRFPEGTPLVQIQAAIAAKEGGPNARGLPQAGATTPAAGAVMPGSQTVPEYMGSEDIRQLAIANALGGPRAVSTALERSPGRIYREEYAKKLSDNQAALEERQRAGRASILPGIQSLRELVQSIPDEDWKMAAGPKNTTEMPASATVPFSYEAWRAPNMTAPQARTMFGPWADDQNYKRHFAIQNDLKHRSGVIAEAVLAAMGKQGGAAANSDARLKVFQELIDKAISAPDNRAALGILRTAEQSMRGTFNLPERREPPPDAVEFLRSRPKDPIVKRAFEQKYRLNADEYLR